jgi:hypothetical protein
LGTVYGKTGTTQNTYLGYNAGLNTTGNYNSALGVDALKTNVSGEQITAIGWNSGKNSTGTRGTFLGCQAGQDCTGIDNTGVGNQALQQVSSGAYNTGVGSYALAGTTAVTGSSNTAVGYRALYANTTGASNVGIGPQTLESVTTAASNVAVGAEALKSLQTTNSNVAVGKSAGQSTTTGYENVFVGAGAGSINTTGYFNIFIGNKAGENNGPTTGSTNTLIGNDARVTATNSNTQLVVASRQSATAKGDNTGFIDGGTGGIYQGNNSANWSTTSDRRLKKNIVNNNVGLEKITQIQVRNFEYRLVEEITELPSHAAIQKEGVQLGVIAQELQQILPDCVKTETTGVMSVDSDNLTWYMINAIKELKAEFDAYKLTHP